MDIESIFIVLECDREIELVNNDEKKLMAEGINRFSRLKYRYELIQKSIHDDDGFILCSSDSSIKMISSEFGSM